LIITVSAHIQAHHFGKISFMSEAQKHFRAPDRALPSCTT